MRAIKFNTGREYSAVKQPITAWVTAEEVDEFGTHYTVKFVDEGRSITGVIQFMHALTPTAVMCAYDKGSYSAQCSDREELARIQAVAVDTPYYH